MVPETVIGWRHTRGSKPQPPRFPSYAVVHAHTGEVVSLHKSRGKANAARSDHAHRVRGSYAEALA